MNRPALKIIRLVLAAAGVAVVSTGGMVHTNAIPRKQGTPHRNERRIIEPNRNAVPIVEPLSTRL